MAPADIPAQVSDDEVVMHFGDRRYRIRGLAKNLSYETLKVNVLVSRGEVYYVDTFDLYAARARHQYLLHAAAEIAVKDEIVKADLGRVLLKLEAVQDAKIKAALKVEPELPAMSEAERTDALALLQSPDLLNRILADFSAIGVVGELVSLRMDDVDLERGTVLIRQGKGAKDRMVPIGSRACRWIEKYLYTVRPLYIDDVDSPALFLAKHGEGMRGAQLSLIVKKAIEAANLERFQDTHPNAACHLFRHACATHMLENGCDIRYIQALLGHEDLSTTEVYTRVSILQLKAVHERTHPARLNGRNSNNGKAGEANPADPREMLLAALGDERDD